MPRYKRSPNRKIRRIWKYALTYTPTFVFNFTVFSDVTHCSLVTSVSEGLAAFVFRTEPKNSSWCSRLHGATSQNTLIIVVSTVGTSNLTQLVLLFYIITLNEHWHLKNWHPAIPLYARYKSVCLYIYMCIYTVCMHILGSHNLTIESNIEKYKVKIQEALRNKQFSWKWR
jgi:hypothetical protein